MLILNEYTEYLPVDEWQFKLTGTYMGINRVSEWITIRGPYTHKWTLTIVSEIEVKLTEN